MPLTLGKPSLLPLYRNLLWFPSETPESTLIPHPFLPQPWQPPALFPTPSPMSLLTLAPSHKQNRLANII